MPSLVGNKDRREQRAVEQSGHIAQLYVGRRKVWEGRAATHEEAANMAKREKESKYRGLKSTTVIKERGADNA